MDKKEKKKKIYTQTKLLANVIKHILFWPYVLLQVLTGKKPIHHLLNPIKEIIKYFFQAKFTALVVIVNIIVYFITKTLTHDQFQLLLSKPENLLSLNFIPTFTSAFMHLTPTHLILNIVGILLFGRIVEKKFGFIKTALIYFGAIIISDVFSSLIHLYILQDNIAALGASGALMGLTATAILLNPFYITFESLVPLPVMITGWLIILADIQGVLNPTQTGVGHFAHLGGFFSIALLMFFLSKKDRQKLKIGLWINLISLAIGIALYFLIPNFPQIF